MGIRVEGLGFTVGPSESALDFRVWGAGMTHPYTDKPWILGGSWVVISRVYGVPLRVPLKGSLGFLGFRVHG